MAQTVIKIPKKFADICAAVRDGKSEGLERLNNYDGLENQRIAVLAEVAYFNGDFAQALDYDKQICGFWGEWHYANVRKEHVSAMAFAARLLGREEEVIRFFEQMVSAVESDSELPEHLKRSYCHCYQTETEYIKTGIVPRFTEQETYVPPEASTAMDAFLAELAAEKKPVAPESDAGQLRLFAKCYRKGVLDDALTIYEKIADNNLSTQWHIMALCGYNHLGNRDKAFDIVLRMAKQRLWLVASNTQVRPMEFFTHPAVFGFLSDKDRLADIVRAASDVGG